MFATVIGAFVSGGIFVAVIPTGLLALRLVLPASQPALRPTTRFAWAIAIGIAAWSLPLMGSVVVGWYKPVLIGTVAWITVGLMAAKSFRGWRNDHRRTFMIRFQPGVQSVAISAAILGLAFLYLGFPNESLLGTRDESLYTLIALHLERTGTLALALAPAANAFSPLFTPLINEQAFYVPGVYATASGPVLQFSPLLPAWIAQLHATLEDVGLFRINGILALAAAPLFFALCREIVRLPVALLCTALFALNAAQVWSSRVNLSELLAQVLLLGGCGIAAHALRIRSFPLVLVAPVLFAVAAFTRIDSILIAPLIIAGASAEALSSERSIDRRAQCWLSLATVTPIAQAIALLALWRVTPPYIADNAHSLLLVAAMTLGLGLVYVLVRRSGARVVAPMIRKAVTLALIVLLIGLFMYAAWLRPDAEPFSIIARAGSPLDGSRDFRENTLLNLAQYLGWPTLFAALIGSCIGLWSIARHRASSGLALLTAIGIGSSLAVLMNPMVSPDHFWAIRRFIPLAIPTLIVFAGIGMQAVLHRMNRLRQQRLIAILTIVAVSWLLFEQRATLFFAENRGVSAALRDIVKDTASAQSLIVRDLDPLATTLLVGFDRPVLPLRDSTIEVSREAQAFWAACVPSARCVLVHSSFAGLSGVLLGASTELSFSRQFIAPTLAPLPKTIARQTARVIATPVLGLVPESRNRVVGAVRDWTLYDRGLYEEESDSSWAWRWTNGDALLQLPDIEADLLEMIVGAGATPATRIEIALDGKTMRSTALAPGRHRLLLPLSHGWNQKGPRKLSIRSSTFVPRDQGIGPDDRRLGVAVYAVRLIDSTVARLKEADARGAYRVQIESLDFGPRASLRFEPDTQPGVRMRLSIVNAGNAVWPASGEVQPGEAPVLLGVRWLGSGQTQPALEQRVALPFSLRPGEGVVLSPVLSPVIGPGRVLPPGEYDVHIGLVQEGVTWFADRGGDILSFSATILSDRTAVANPSP